MSLYKKLFKQTLLYGLATVLPRMLAFFLLPLYVNHLPTDEYGSVSYIFSYMVFFNVVLSYGMETAFFRFYNSETEKNKVVNTSLISIFWTTISFLFVGILFRNQIANITDIKVDYITYTIWILVLDALVVIPFSILRATQKPMQYALIKILNVIINFGLNIFFIIYLPNIAQKNPDGILATFYFENFQVGYIFVSNLIASLITFLIVTPHYFTSNWQIDKPLWNKMTTYGFPILIAGIAFSINEHFDKILLKWLNVPLSEIGAYSACYKLGLFMVLFRTAYTLGIEPFFFSHSSDKNAPQTYATITKYFVVFGSFIALSVIVFADLFKQYLIPNESYWNAMKVVPLIVFANFFLGIYTNLSVWYKLMDKTKIGAYISIVGAVITLALNFILIPLISYYGSALATIFAYGIMMVVSYQMGKNKYPIPYDHRRIFTYIGLSILFSILVFYVDFIRENYFIKIAILLVFLGIIYTFEKQTILQIIKRKK